VLHHKDALPDSHQRGRFFHRGPVRNLGAAVLLFALNAGITPLLFRTAYTAEMGSIEGAFIGLARYASRHWSDMGWFPLWYGGVSYPESYPPLLHWIVGLVLSLTGVSPGLAYHFVTAMAYALGPVTLFWMAWRLCGNRACALAAALVYSLVSPTCLLVRAARLDYGDYLGPRRLAALVLWGEGPHITSLCLLPLAIGLLHVALTRRKPWHWVAAAIAIASVPLTNWIGGMALAIAVAAYLFAGLPGNRKTPAAVLSTGAAGVYAYAIAVPWLPPSAISVIRANAPRVANDFHSDPQQRIFAAAVAVVFFAGAWGMARWSVPRHTRFALLAALVTGSSALGKYWFGWTLVPQPERYQLEMDMFLCLAGVFLFWPAATQIAAGLASLRARRPAWAALAALAIAAALIAGGVHVVKKQRRLARWMERPIDIRTTIEHKTAMWLDAHMPGARVFAPGSIGFWLNAFGESPQLTGGFDNGIRNPVLPAVLFNVYADANQTYMVQLLQAFGCDAMIGGGKDSAEWYHPIAHPEKLRGLTELWRDGGDAVYDIPRRSRSLAHVMRMEDQVTQPLARYGFSALTKYLDALNNPEYPPAAFRWLAPSAARITADMKPDQILSVQIAWDAGWNVSAGGRRARTWSDALGQMVVDPRCSGRCAVELKYDGGLEGACTRVIHGAAMAGGGVWILAALLRRKRAVEGA
jgi:hypothetical protein